MARKKIAVDDLEIDIAKAVIVNTLALNGHATAGELKRAVENVLISASWGQINKELSELQKKKYIEAEDDGLGEIAYKLTKKGLKFAQSKQVQNILEMVT